MDPGRLPRRRGLLRHQWLPDHRAAAGGASPAGPRRSQGLLAAARPPAAPSVVPLARGHARVRRRVSARGGREATQRRGCCVRLRDQLVPRIQQRVLLRDRRPAVAAAAPLVARGRGAILRVVAAAIRRRDNALAPLHVARRARGRGGVGLADGDPLPARRRSLAHLLRDRYPGHRPPPRSGTRLRVGAPPGYGPDVDETLCRRSASPASPHRATETAPGPVGVDRPVAARRRWSRRARRARRVLYPARSVPAVPLPGWHRAGRAHHRRGDHGHSPPPYAPGSGPARTMPPLRWIGLRSYGIYLWHWPVFMVTRPE